MNGTEFIRRIKKLGRERGIEVRFESRHGRAAMAGCTTVKDRKKEIGKGLFGAMLEQLGLSQNDLK